MLSFINTWIADGINNCMNHVRWTCQYVLAKHILSPTPCIGYTPAPRRISRIASQKHRSKDISSIKSQYQFDYAARTKIYQKFRKSIQHEYQKNCDKRRRMYLRLHKQIQHGYLADRKKIKPNNNTSMIESLQYRIDIEYENDLYRLKDRYQKDVYVLKDQYEKDLYTAKDRYEKDLYLLKEQCNKKLLSLGCLIYH
jgi:hypothetical protein